MGPVAFTRMDAMAEIMSKMIMKLVSLATREEARLNTDDVDHPISSHVF